MRKSRIVVAGYAENLSTGLNNFALVRYEPNGSLDPTFGDAGRVITDVGGFSNAFALVIQPHDARLVVAGGLSGNGFALARYHAITCNGVVVTQVGTAGDDTIIGTEGHDVIWGFPGNDLIEGLGGDDLLCGGKGDDTLRGGSGKDILDGGAGKDRCNGGSGQDMARECEKVTNVP